MPYRTVAIIGPPNVGKSTLFNRLTGLRQKVGNYSGVTVEQRAGQIKGTRTTLLDLPGVWSVATENSASFSDSSDSFESSGPAGSYGSATAVLTAPAVTSAPSATITSEDQRIAIRALRGEIEGQPRPEAVLLILDATQLHRQMTLAREVIAHKLPTLVVINMADLLASRHGYLDPLSLAKSLNAPVAMVSASSGSGMEAIQRFVGAKTAAAKAPVLPVMQPHVEPRHVGCPRSQSEIESTGLYRRPMPSSWSRRIDQVALHPIFGPALFFVVTLAVFQTVFRVAAPASDLFQLLLTRLGNAFGQFLPSGFIHSLVMDGLWAGVVSVLTFLPLILLLFLVIALLEDSGYMARAAVIADRTMYRFGLSGRSFLPLLSAYACAVPAIMATRTIASRRDRLTTILVAPFMTCSARLPLYTMIIAAFIPDRPVLGQLLGLRACAMLGLYVIGMVAALVTSRLLHFSLLRRDDSTFAIELPEYRLPLWRSLVINLLDRARIFVKQVGTIILLTSLAVWILANFPVHHGQLSPIGHSYLGAISNTIEPALKPIGLDRNIGVALLTAFVARETVVSTLGTLYQTPQVGAALQHSIGLAGALSLLVFFALAMQCFSTLATVKRETNSWRWPIFQFLYMSGIAYAAAFITYRLALWLM